MLRPDRVLVCVGYFFDESQHDMLRPYLPPGASLIVGNWRNRTSCLLRLVDVIARGDGLVWTPTWFSPGGVPRNRQ
jgi:hypothetical protein